MRNKSTSFIIYIFLIFYSCNLTAQQKSDITISPGFGLCNFGNAIGNEYDSPSLHLRASDSPVILSTLPEAYNVNLDYQITHKESVGIGICYQYAYIARGDYSYLTTYYWETITRTNIGVRWFYCITNKSNDEDKQNTIEANVGVRVGLSFWSDIPAFGFIVPSNIPNYIMAPFHVISFQALAIIRAYPFNKLTTPVIRNIGLHLEGGVGTPYFLEGGLSYRLGKKNT